MGGLYLDYDQYLHGAIGPGGTFWYGYLAVFGGIVAEERQVVDGRECVVVTHPHMGSDQVYTFYLDPALNYSPRRLEQRFEHELYRRIDYSGYREIDGIHYPTGAEITDYCVKGTDTGKVVGRLTMEVTDITLNGDSESLRAHLLED